MQKQLFEAASLEEASGPLLDFALDPVNWLPIGRQRANAGYFRRVEGVQVCVSVDVTPTLETYLRVSFRGAELSPMKAADLLETFVRGRFTFTPNIEWEVEIDGRGWIHFTRRYTGRMLEA